MHHFNRLYLLISILISLAIPFITFEYIKIIPVVENIQPENNNFISKSSEELIFNENKIQTEDTINYIPYLIWMAYVSVTLLLLVRLGKNYLQLLTKIKSNSNIKYKNANLVLMEEKILPHTFLNTIFVNSEDYKNSTIEEELFAHELVHVTQKHTLDILFLELLKAIFWFNPLFIFYKKAIQLNHEFLADEEIVKTYDNVPFYQNLLLQKGNDNQTVYLASNLNYLVTKKRLLMMTKKTSQKLAVLKKIAVVPILAGLIYFFCVQVVAQEKKVYSKSNVKISETDKDRLRDAYYLNVRILLKDLRKNKNISINKMYEELSLQQKREYLNWIPNKIVEKELPLSLFEQMKTKNLAVWINGKVSSKQEINQYKRTDFKYYTFSFVHKNARSKRFPQEYQYSLYTKKYFDTYLKNSHLHYSNDTCKMVFSDNSNKVLKKKNSYKKNTAKAKKEYSIHLNLNKEEFVEDKKTKQKRDFAYEDIMITIIDKDNNVNVTKKYKDLDLKIKQRYLKTHMFYLVGKRIPNQELFEKFKNEKKYLIFINDRRVENAVLSKMKRTNIYYYAEMVNPPTSTRDNLYFLYTKEFYESQLTGQLKNRTKKIELKYQ
ncbi:M56 family metallopeptidase [Flavobacterium sp. KDG-16]|uniref:M56 family metallopeptidase n=2 Tax=Flavobacterium difficile TaxID=2709659 RepID=A0ABX0I4I4_9FLAO|nr:M56 family metallopeptidase [Flavobacterium difficile]